jgi:hypothetical protein
LIQDDDRGNECDSFFGENEESENEDLKYEDFLRNQDFAELEIESENLDAVESAMLSYSIEIMQGNYTAARSKLNFDGSQSELMDLSYVLNLYTDLLETSEEENIFPQNTIQNLENIATKPHTYSAYAQALYFMITGEFVDNLDLSILDSYEIDERSHSVNNKSTTKSTELFFPNPAKEVIYINNAHSIRSLRVYNNLGGLVYSAQKVEDTIQIQEWQDGLYFIDVEMLNGDKKIIKLIKNK